MLMNHVSAVSKRRIRTLALPFASPISPFLGLRTLAKICGADKPNHYIRHYSQHFRRLRHRRLRVLEIGVGGYGDPSAGGGSLRMWARFFWRSHVFGLDISDKSPHDAPRIRTLIGDQNDSAHLHELGETHGPFDIIVDDGSHVSEHVITSFNALFSDHLAEGGVYVVEDLHTSYWPQFNGATDTTSMDFLKSLADSTNAQFVPCGRVPFGDEIASVTFYPEIVFVRKGGTRRRLPDFLRREIEVAAETLASSEVNRTKIAGDPNP